MTADQENERSLMMLSILTSIDGSLKKLVAIAEKRKVGDSAGPAVADDQELDSKYGDEPVKFDPRDYTGRSCKGLSMSQCPADFLDCLATSYEHFARKNADNGDPKKAGYDRRSAARARGWAKRLRGGWKPAQASMQDNGADDFGMGADDF